MRNYRRSVIFIYRSIDKNNKVTLITKLVYDEVVSPFVLSGFGHVRFITKSILILLNPYQHKSCKRDQMKRVKGTKFKKTDLIKERYLETSGFYLILEISRFYFFSVQPEEGKCFLNFYFCWDVTFCLYSLLS